ncbi:hypothetical protein [Halobacillus sp. Marseille-P3879]|uniref:hypothetical protein n=1 Tax=Halobacillus sp. Marseille-P3879 TaxID=2045014 RepID=UPI000C7A8D95|nr:hypothetical protein [Halobacillus sp. Marseille-P3879]
MSNKRLISTLIASLVLTGCMVENVENEPENASEENGTTNNKSGPQLDDGEWEFSEELETKLIEALGKDPHEATEEELYEVLEDELLRQQYLDELYELLDLKVEDGLISRDEADAQKETMEFIFEEE